MVRHDQRRGGRVFSLSLSLSPPLVLLLLLSRTLSLHPPPLLSPTLTRLRLEARLPYRAGNNAKLEACTIQVLGALTLCPRGKMPGRLDNRQVAPSGLLPARVVLRPSMAWPIEVSV